MLKVLAIAGIVAAQIGTGRINGSVIEKSGGKMLPASGVIVQLSILKNDLQVAGARTTTDAKGRYSFSEIQTGTDYAYQISARPKNVPFGSGVLTFSGRSELKAPDLVIQPVTGKLEKISAEEVVLLEFGGTNLMKVTHSIVFGNSGNVLYDGRVDGAAQIEVPLPDQGMSLEVSPSNPDDQADLVEGKNILRMTVQVPPNGDPSRKINYAYILPYTHHDQAMSLSMNVPRTQLTVASVGKKISIDSAILKKAEERNRDGKTFYVYSGGPVAKEPPVTFILRGLPLNTDTGHRLIYISFALILLGAGVLILKGQRNSQGPERMEDLKSHFLDRLTQIERRARTGGTLSDEHETEKARLGELLFDLESMTSETKAA